MTGLNLRANTDYTLAVIDSWKARVRNQVVKNGSIRFVSAENDAGPRNRKHRNGDIDVAYNGVRRVVIDYVSGS